MGNSSAITARISCYAAFIATYVATSSLMVERHIQSTQKSSFSNKLELRFLSLCTWLNCYPNGTKNNQNLLHFVGRHV